MTHPATSDALFLVEQRFWWNSLDIPPIPSRLTGQANDRRPGHAHAGTPGQLD
jgi:hypothetical protein